MSFKYLLAFNDNFVIKPYNYYCYYYYYYFIIIIILALFNVEKDTIIVITNQYWPHSRPLYNNENIQL